jgi:hypothetical protein
VTTEHAEVHVWAIEQVVAFAGSSARFGAGEAAAVPARWAPVGASEQALWGRYHGSGAEPYDVAVDHLRVSARCSCPSRVSPCKHAVGLLVLWVRGHVAVSAEPPAVARWIERQQRTPAAEEPAAPAVRDETPITDRLDATSVEVPERGRDERIAALVGGLVELDRWLEDRVRIGLADPSIARFATWDEVARRLTDARAGALANRVRRLAGRVGAEPDWHANVLAEIGILHLLARAGQRVPQLPGELADGVAVTCGWQVRKADVEAAVPETDRWLVVGRSDTREDLVEVRRVWLRGIDSGRWAMALSFAAYRQALDDSLAIGTVVHGDIHRYPGSGQRALVGAVSAVDVAPSAACAAATDATTTTAGACALVGAVLAAEPWLERVPAVVTAAVTRSAGAWLLTDDIGSLPIAPESARSDAVATLLAASAGAPLTIAVEWTARGFLPITVFLDDRIIDVGPRADPSFVSAA